MDCSSYNQLIEAEWRHLWFRYWVFTCSVSSYNIKKHCWLNIDRPLRNKLPWHLIEFQTCSSTKVHLEMSPATVAVIFGSGKINLNWPARMNCNLVSNHRHLHCLFYLTILLTYRTFGGYRVLVYGGNYGNNCSDTISQHRIQVIATQPVIGGS